MAFGPPNALESAPSALGMVPPDNQPMTIGEHLQAAFARIAEDRSLDNEEMREVMAFMQGIKMLAQQRKTQGQTLGGQPEPEQPQGFQAGESEEYGAGAGTPLPGYEGE